MNVWNGIFNPEPGRTLQKSIETAEFIPINKMSPEDWRLLDWDVLSNTAKNAIVKVALSKGIKGFVLYKFVQKGDRQRGYLGPVPNGADPEAYLALPRFTNFSDDESLSEGAQRLNASLDKVAGAALSVKDLVVIAGIMAKAAGSDETGEEYLNKLMDGDFTDYQELDLMLTWVLASLHELSFNDKEKLEALEEWANEAEQILGDAEEKGLL
jgi:hypothetical protein